MNAPLLWGKSNYLGWCKHLLDPWYDKFRKQGSGYHPEVQSGNPSALQKIMVILMYLSGRNKLGANKTKAFFEGKGMCFGAGMKIIWGGGEQLVYPPIDYLL